MALWGTKRAGRRTAGMLLGVVGMAGLWCATTGGAAVASDAGAVTDATTLVAAVNSDRSGLGLGALRDMSDLDTVAANYAKQMGDAGVLAHNPNLGTQVTGWLVVGENVGVGGTLDDVHQAWLRSDAHRHNIEDPRFSEIGVGIAEVGGYVWAVEVFRQPEPAATPSYVSASSAASSTGSGATSSSASTSSATSGSSDPVMAPAAAHASPAPRPVHTTAPRVAAPATPARAVAVSSAPAAAVSSASDATLPVIVFDGTMSSVSVSPAAPAAAAPAAAAPAASPRRHPHLTVAAFAALLWLGVALAAGDRMVAAVRRATGFPIPHPVLCT